MVLLARAIYLRDYSFIIRSLDEGWALSLGDTWNGWDETHNPDWLPGTANDPWSEPKLSVNIICKLMIWRQDWSNMMWWIWTCVWKLDIWLPEILENIQSYNYPGTFYISFSFIEMGSLSFRSWCLLLNSTIAVLTLSSNAVDPCMLWTRYSFEVFTVITVRVVLSSMNILDVFIFTG